MYQDNITLCGASAYEKKFYFNQDFNALPDHVKKELQIMCVLYTEDVGGILTLEFDENGRLQFKTEALEADARYDEIGSGLKIKQLQQDKKELLESLEMYYNGRMAPIPIKRLELAGLYQFRLWDRAGNERYYQIRIAERLRPPSPKTIIITILGVGAAAGWFFYQRRHPRFL